MNVDIYSVYCKKCKRKTKSVVVSLHRLRGIKYKCLECSYIGRFNKIHAELIELEEETIVKPSINVNKEDILIKL